MHLYSNVFVDKCATKANKQEQSHFYARPDVPGDGSRRTAGKFLSNWPKHNECKVFLEDRGDVNNILLVFIEKRKKQGRGRLVANYYSLLFDREATINFHPDERIL